MTISKKIFLTGASGGIGSAICDKFQNEKYSLILTSSSTEKLQKLKDKYGTSHYYYEIDLSNSETLQNSLDEISQDHKDISVIVNNAGKTHDNLIFRMKKEQWSEVIQTNLKGAFYGIKSAIRPMMKNKCGRIINITSIVGLTGNPGQANYAASKAGLIGMTQSIAKEFASRGITANCIAPGWIDTEMTVEISEDSKEDLLDKIPIRKIGKPEDIAHAAVFLASDEASYITGQTIVVDGGRVIN